MSRSECPSEALILDFVSGSLLDAARAPLERHIARCDECRQLVSALAQSSLVVSPPLSYTRPQDIPMAHAKTLRSAPPQPQGLAEGQGEGHGPGHGYARGPANPRGAPVSPVQPGDVLAGKYQVERVLGAGGMGVVVQALHLQLRQRVALKFLLPAAYEASGAVARFVREARAAAQIRSEHVARVTDVGTLENGAPYLVMELLEGTDLSIALTQRGRGFEIDEAIEFVLQACEAIAEAHALGIVHRDLKPANLFLSERPDGSPLVKVLDFGISKVTEGGSVPLLTTREVMMGSPRYMSPEQMQSARDVDRRTDVWALGAILYELVVGTPAFDADSIAALCARIATEPPPRVRKLRGDAPVVLEAVILRCLEKDLSRRIASVADLALQLRPVAPERARLSIERILRIGDGRDARRATPAPPMPMHAAVFTPPALSGIEGITGGSFGGTKPFGHRGTSLGLVLGAVIALLLGVGVVLVARLPSSHNVEVANLASSTTAAGTKTPTETVPIPSATAGSDEAALAPLVSSQAHDAGPHRVTSIPPRVVPLVALAPAGGHPATPPLASTSTNVGPPVKPLPPTDTQNSSLVDRK